MADNHLNEAERADFEAWAAKEHPEAHATLRADGEYQHGGMRDWWPCWLAARCTAADGAALDLPPLPEPPRAVLEHPNLGGLFDRFKMHQYAVAYADLAIAHYLRKQGGEVEGSSNGES